VVDRCETELAAACQGAAVIQLAVPILAMEKLLGQLAKLELGDAVLTDVGSAKGNVVRAARLAFDGKVARFVPGHPIAGSEQSGVEASNAELFRRHKVILTPQASTDASALALVDGLWRALGADVEHMEVDEYFDGIKRLYNEESPQEGALMCTGLTVGGGKQNAGSSPCPPLQPARET